MTIGVFDSGIGGEAVAQSLRTAFPDATITVVNDREHLPYGSRSENEIRTLTDTAIQPLLRSDVIVIACNTATAVAIDWLRARYPWQQFIGLEPMVKPAAQDTRTGVVTICATPATLASRRYAKLKHDYGAGVTFFEPDCSDWAQMIEDNSVNEAAIASVVDESKQRGADIIVLACTHYHWIKQQIKNQAGATIKVIDPSMAIVRRVGALLAHS